MDVTVLSVPDCPNAALLEQRLTEVIEGRTDVTMTRLVITDEPGAVRAGMHGSPTVLINGKDPFAAPGEPASLSCRLYPARDGDQGGLPSVSALRRALEEPAGS